MATIVQDIIDGDPVVGLCALGIVLCVVTIAIDLLNVMGGGCY